MVSAPPAVIPELKRPIVSSLQASCPSDWHEEMQKAWSKLGKLPSFGQRGGSGRAIPRSCGCRMWLTVEHDLGLSGRGRREVRVGRLAHVLRPEVLALRAAEGAIFSTISNENAKFQGKVPEGLLQKPTTKVRFAEYLKCAYRRSVYSRIWSSASPQVQRALRSRNSSIGKIISCIDNFRSLNPF